MSLCVLVEWSPLLLLSQSEGGCTTVGWNPAQFQPLGNLDEGLIYLVVSWRRKVYVLLVTWLLYGFTLSPTSLTPDLQPPPGQKTALGLGVVLRHTRRLIGGSRRNVMNYRSPVSLSIRTSAHRPAWCTLHF